MFRYSYYRILKIRSLFIFLFCVQGLFLCGQTSFGVGYLVDETDDFDSFVAIGVADMNADHKDDVIFFDRDQNLHIAYQTAPDAPFEIEEIGISPAAICRF